MRKIEIGVLCIALCIAVAVILPQVGVSWTTVDDSGCLACHDAAFPSGDLHSKHSSCDACHAESADTPATSTCIVCHPMGDAGECPLVNSAGHSGSCTPCHDSECDDTTPDPTTTTTADVDITTTTTPAADTTTTTAAADICPSQEIYGANSAEVQVLRFVRDNILAATPEGREIISLYYQLSPVIVAAMQNDPAFKAEMKAISDGVLQLVVQ